MPKRKFAGANKELLFLEAKKYNSRTSFFRGSRSAYKECLRQDIMDEACIHTVKFNKFNGNHGNCKLLNEELILLAKNFIQKSHFKEAHPSCYKAIRTRGLASLAYSHMPPTGNRYFRKIYVFEFSDNSAYIGLSYNPEKRYKDHMRDNPLLIEKSIANDCNFKILTELLPAKIAQEKEIFFIEHYKKLGWITLNKARGGSLGPNFQKWNKIKCAELALYFTNRSSFSKSSPGAYN